MTRPADEFAAHCVELLAPLGAADARRMFGGHGLYLDGLMVGLIAAEQLYFKTDAQTRAQWEAAGGRPFVYQSRRGGEPRVTSMSYWTPPAEAIESPALMRPWARLALEAALRAQAARAVRPPKRSTAGRAAGKTGARKSPAKRAPRGGAAR